MKTPDGQEITDQLLCDRFPRLFADRRASMRETALCWGFEVGPGWMRLLYDTADRLEPLIVAYIKEHGRNQTYFHWCGFGGPFGYLRNPQVLAYQVIRWLKIKLRLMAPEPWWPRASQIKEKYGTLRFYLTSGTDLMYTLVDEAESQSAKICETCGGKGRLRGRGWFYVSCSKHVRKDDR